MAGRGDNNNVERTYLGVRNRGPGRYGAEVYDRASKSRVWLGMFDTALEAALAYDKAARRLNGSRANTNFPRAFDVPDDDDDDDYITFEEVLRRLLSGPVDEPPAEVDLDLRIGPPGSSGSRK